MTQTSPADIVRHCLEGFDGSQGAIGQVMDCCADRLVLEIAPTDEQATWQIIEGKESVREFLQFAYGLGSDLLIVIRDLVASTDTALVVFTSIATQVVELHGLPAGTRTRTEFVWRFRFADGAIVSWRIYLGPHLVDGTTGSPE
jgi:ketosteroid isomerase-like protein